MMETAKAGMLTRDQIPAWTLAPEFRAEYVAAMLAKAPERPPERVILGCTHFPLVEHLFRAQLPPSTRVLSQPQVVADSLEDYLARHKHFASPREPGQSGMLLTSGDPKSVEAAIGLFWPDPHPFEAV